VDGQMKDKDFKCMIICFLTSYTYRSRYVVNEHLCRN